MSSEFPTVEIKGVKYVKEKDSDLPLEDPILYTFIPQKHAIIVNSLIYDVNTIYRDLMMNNTNLDLYRQEILSEKLNEIRLKYNEINKQLLRNGNENNSGLSRIEIMDEVRVCLVRQYELHIGLNYHPQTMHGVELVSKDRRKISDLDKKVDMLIAQYSWLKSSRVMSDILKNESHGLKSSLSNWIASLD